MKIPCFVRMLSRAQAKRGFTLTEIAIVLGVIGVILGAIWSAAAHVSNNQKTSTAVRQILTVASGIKALYPNGTIPGGAQDLTIMAINNGVVPSDMLSTSVGGFGPTICSSTSGTQLCVTDPWNTQVSIFTQEPSGGVATSANPNMFAIWLYGLTNAQCAPFLGALVGQAPSAGLAAIYTDGTAPANTYSAANPWTPTTFENCTGNVILGFTL